MFAVVFNHAIIAMQCLCMYHILVNDFVVVILWYSFLSWMPKEERMYMMEHICTHTCSQCLVSIPGFGSNSMLANEAYMYMTVISKPDLNTCMVPNHQVNNYSSSCYLSILIYMLVLFSYPFTNTDALLVIQVHT